MPRRPIDCRVAHKSTGGRRPAIPAPVDPVGNAPSLFSNTVAERSEESRHLWFSRSLLGILHSADSVLNDNLLVQSFPGERRGGR